MINQLANRFRSSPQRRPNPDYNPSTGVTVGVALGAAALTSTAVFFVLKSRADAAIAVCKSVGSFGGMT